MFFYVTPYISPNEILNSHYQMYHFVGDMEGELR